MKKLSLVIEDLEVETFTVELTSGERGTVVGLTGGMQCTLDDFWCSAQVTLNAVDLNCYESNGAGYCTAVCPTGYEVCDTSPQICG
jgi:hypothetical protein